MLGCQDFCGHYDWTFHYIRSRWGQEALRHYWAEAIGGESQQHYADIALSCGLHGLHEQYKKTGEEEHCEWTYTLDESKNVLRCDMRECPSKGFLIKNDLNADEDYCDHCQGWDLPLTSRVGLEIVEHEHNHCGQCWTVYRHSRRPSEAIEVKDDIRLDARWRHGYIHRWEKDRRLPLMPSVSESSDPCDVLTAWFRRANNVIPQGDVACCQPTDASSAVAVIVSDTAYNDRHRCPNEPSAVLFDSPPADLHATASRYADTPVAHRPLLMYAYLPRVPFVDFVSAGLPRPVPILPLLIRLGVYIHQPGGPLATAEQMLTLLTAALDKAVALNVGKGAIDAGPVPQKGPGDH